MWLSQTLLPAFTLLWTLGPVGVAQPQASPSEAQSPRLVVVISIDQFIPDQMERLEPMLQGGLGRLRSQGARFDQAALPYFTTETGPGHATLSTGCLPATHGIVGNVMRLREEGVGLYCVGDDRARDVTHTGVGEKGSVSARNLGVPTLGDWMKAAHPDSKVFSVSGKDRSAVCMAGHQGDLALWWNRAGEGFQTSTAYAQELPDYVQQYNREWVTRWAGTVWQSRFAPDQAPPQTAQDDREGESFFPGGDRVMPHEFEGPWETEPTAAQIQTLSSQLQVSEFGDQVTLEMAQRLVVREGLGLDDVPDLLGIGLSGPDKVGHSFGPYSVEVTNCILAIDEQLGTLFDFLDQYVGQDRWILAMTADHGVLPLPESDSALHGVQGMGRIGADQIKSMNTVVSEALKQAFGADSRGRGLRTHQSGGDLYFDRKDLAARKIDVVQARRVVAEALREKVDWVEAAYTFDELQDSSVPTDDFIEFFRNSFDARYTPDVTILQQHGHILAWTTGTTHGSPYLYDRRVPLYFWGQGFPAGAYLGPAGSHDLVPTVLGVLGIQGGPFDGHDLRPRMR